MRLLRWFSLLLSIMLIAACGEGATTPAASPLALVADKPNFVFFYTDA